MVDKLEDRSMRVWGISKRFEMSLSLPTGSQYDCEQSLFFENSGRMNSKRKSLKNNES